MVVIPHPLILSKNPTMNFKKLLVLVALLEYHWAIALCPAPFPVMGHSRLTVEDVESRRERATA